MILLEKVVCKAYSPQSICGNILRRDCWRYNEEVKEEFILKVVGGGSMHTMREKS
jgi:hypothetical protein